jgi:phosphate transport system substrate-binding protein
MIHKNVISFLVVALISATAVAAEKIVLATGALLLPTINQFLPEFQKKSGIQVSQLHEEGMSGESIWIAVDQGKVDAGIVSNDKKAIMKGAADKGISLSQLTKLETNRLMDQQLSIVLFKGAPSKLTKDQVQKIFTGKILNWKEVGGPDVPVQIAILHNSTITQKFISDKFLDGQDIFKKGIKTFPSDKELLAFIDSTKGAISIANLSPDSKINRVDFPELKRNIYLVTVGGPSPNLQKFIEFANSKD